MQISSFIFKLVKKNWQINHWRGHCFTFFQSSASHLKGFFERFIVLFPDLDLASSALSGTKEKHRHVDWMSDVKKEQKKIDVVTGPAG